MNINDLNNIIVSFPEQKRENILDFSFALLQWMGIEPNTDVPGAKGEIRPRLLSPQTQKLKEFLAHVPQTVQPQLYRLSAENQNVKVRFAVLKKLRKETISQLVDNDPGLTSFQASIKGIINVPGRPPYIPQQPYFIHFVTTPAYNKLVLIFSEGDQKRILVFRNRLSQTQFNRILPAWQNIAGKSKLEIANLFWSSLDVKEVNKDFYRQVKDQFDSLIGTAKAQKPDVDEAITKQFAVRLIGRYIFCWFLKEKEVIPELLVASKTIERYKDTYFQTLLTKLFFKTLNAEVTDKARNETITELDELYKNIPYLNGGLFDWHPEDVLFNQIDLNEWLIAFVQVLERFDFTVDESSSTYQHVAIDPEMLGRIFENLLASQNPDTEKMANQRKAFGAFYTPREIVDYMVNESLKAYLETQLMPSLPEKVNAVSEPAVAYKGTLFQDVVTTTEPTAISKAEIADIERKRERIKLNLDKLFTPDCTDNPFEKEETINVRKSLSEITVLDPACGSGAFPMGVMLRLMELRQIIGHGHRNSYDLKEEILSRNIFGVDIMPMAVEIARLRAWLSLVLEADYRPNDRKNNFGIAALPNLDFKFVCANSLIDSGYDDFIGKIHLNLTLYRLDGEIQKLERIRNDYFDPKGDKGRKQELQTEFEYTKQYIKAQLNQSSLRKNYNLDDFFNKVDDWNPFDDSHPSSFFSPAWMFGIRNGFDVVIGNPPYVSANNMKFEQRVFFNSYSYYNTLKGKWDLYVAFTERSLRLLRTRGVFTFIVPFGLLNQPFAQHLRTLILSDYKLVSIVDLHNNKIFENATVPSCIPLIKKGISKNHDVVILDFKDLKFEKLHLIGIEKYSASTQQMFRTEDLDVKTAVLDKIRQKGENLDSFFYCSTGAEIHGKEIRNDNGTLTSGKSKFDVLHDQSNEGLMPYIEGSDIKKSKEGRYSWPSITQWIDFSKPEEMRSAKFRELFESEKIIIRRSSGLLRILAVYDNRKIYTSEKCILILNKSSLPKKHSHYESNDKLDLKYLIAILNSQLIDFYYESVYGGFIDVYPNNLKELPIVNCDQAIQSDFVSRVEMILDLRKEDKVTTDLEKEIDVMVYKLYELTFEEVKVVDKDFWMGEDEYEKMKTKD
ncbi:MAG: TaqI-like C-terminal specificity domain-containing protein [Bacteroidota bacterium]|nr:TaqI-like C-terminal specificity domain-containing protein [Bacteroidota bacterium]